MRRTGARCCGPVSTTVAGTRLLIFWREETPPWNIRGMVIKKLYLFLGKKKKKKKKVFRKEGRVAPD